MGRDTLEDVDPRNPPNEYQQVRIALALERIATVLETVVDWSFDEAAIATRSK